VEKEGTDTFPAMGVQSLRSPLTAPITLTKPVAPDAGATLTVPVTQAFEVAWPVPGGTITEQRLFVSFTEIDNAAHSKRAFLLCGYPLSQGQASIPANLLADLKSRLGSNGTGFLRVSTGGQKEATPSGASYVIEVTRPDTTNLAFDPTNVVIQ